jgi:hypothetical protein
MFDEDNVFLIFMILGIVAICAIAFIFDNSNAGPATKSVEACAAIEDVEKSIACFEAIEKTR